ncbi:MAG: asparagine--tRNA ligase [Chlamydiae bacterium]|nr:asparagine--tRNA ligase [Chlamydiota bacterium]
MLRDTENTYKRIKIKELKTDSSLIDQEVTVKGWVRTLRLQKAFAFMEVNDGSTVSNIQVVLNNSLSCYEELTQTIQTGACVRVVGSLVSSLGGKQAVEIQAKEVEILGNAPADFVLQKKRHSFEFLRTIAHLRPRTNTFGAVMRVRNSLAFATHKFFQERDFLYLNTPIITSSDCEGAGEMFAVSTLDLENPPKNESGKIDFTQDFFGKKSYLTVSGQLNGEAYALALSDIYTFGPTFRAENSNTSRHLAEFWMIEPEMAFADLKDDMDLADDYLKYLIEYLLNHNTEDLEFFNSFISNGLLEKLSHILETPTVRVSYTEAISILEKANAPFVFPVKWGIDLQSEHERFLTEVHFKGPAIVYNYPKEIKSFYMRRNNDEKTVAAMDLLVPGIGELIGGSQREERLEVLEQTIRNQGLDIENYDWYLDLRRYGSAPHAGFGLGFERLVQYTTGMENIRDVIPFPRYPQHALF